MGNFSIFGKNGKMIRGIFLLAGAIFGICAMVHGQTGFHKSAKGIQPDTTFENVLVRRLYSNEEASGFVIWIKQQVPLHKHLAHSETVTILSGKAMMRLGDQTMAVQKGDIIFIPKGTPHSVTVSRGTLKVLSVQAPMFDGSDRVMVTD